MVGRGNAYGGGQAQGAAITAITTTTTTATWKLTVLEAEAVKMMASLSNLGQVQLGEGNANSTSLIPATRKRLILPILLVDSGTRCSSSHSRPRDRHLASFTVTLGRDGRAGIARASMHDKQGLRNKRDKGNGHDSSNAFFSSYYRPKNRSRMADRDDL